MKSADYFFSNPAHRTNDRQTESTDHITSLAAVTMHKDYVLNIYYKIVQTRCGIIYMLLFVILNT